MARYVHKYNEKSAEAETLEKEIENLMSRVQTLSKLKYRLSECEEELEIKSQVVR